MAKAGSACKHVEVVMVQPQWVWKRQIACRSTYLNPLINRLLPPPSSRRYRMHPAISRRAGPGPCVCFGEGAGGGGGGVSPGHYSVDGSGWKGMKVGAVAGLVGTAGAEADPPFSFQASKPPHPSQTFETTVTKRAQLSRCLFLRRQAAGRGDGGAAGRALPPRRAGPAAWRGGKRRRRRGPRVAGLARAVVPAAG